MVKKVKPAQKEPLIFEKLRTEVPNEKQQEFFKAENAHIGYGGARYGGKAQPIDEPVLTPFGFRPMGSLKVGSLVNNPDGGVSKVIQIHPQGIKPVYRVIFLDGASTRVTAEHLWLATRTCRRSGLKIYDTDTLRKILLIDGSSPVIPVCESVQFTRGRTCGIIKPYTLGVLLGDGCLVAKNEIRFTTEDEEIVEGVIADGYNVKRRYKENNNAFECAIGGFAMERRELHRLGLLVKSNEKFVPDSYKYARLDDRIALMQGLMDTDGYVDSRGHCSFTSVSKRLAEDVQWLVRSFGGKATITSKQGSYVKNGERVICQTVYTVYIRTKISKQLFSLSRKKERCQDIDKELYHRIVKIEPCGEAECQCITVDNPNGLYITKDFIVTHNSWAMRRKFNMLAMRYPGINILLLRRTLPELRENHLIPLLSELDGYARYSSDEKAFYYPNKSRLKLGYCDSDSDVVQYQGQSYDVVGFEEATNFTETQWSYIKLCCRNSETIQVPFKPRRYYTANPGGVGHCIPYGEVLTPSGWIDIKDIKIGDEVFSLDNEGEMVLSQVEQVHVSEYEGDMAYVDARGLRMACTPNHRVAKICGIRGNNDLLYSLVQFKDLPGQATILRSIQKWEGADIKSFTVPTNELPRAKNKQPKKIDISDFAELFGWFITEGSSMYTEKRKFFTLSQMKIENRNKMKCLLERAGFIFSEDKSGFNVYAHEWALYFTQFGKCRDRFIPQWLKNCSTDILRILFDAMMHGDGHWKTGKSSGDFYSFSEQLADDFSEIALKLGFVVLTGERQKPNRIGKEYRVSFKTVKSGGTEILTGNHVYNVDTTTKRKPNINYEQYKGKIYCIGVPDTHTFFVRQNGSVWVSGNSWFKRLFIDRDFREGENPDDYVFIHAKIYDNTYAMERNPEYLNELKSLPEDLKRAYLDGDWDVFGGQYFREFRREKHVVEPHEVQLMPHWKRFCSIDFGYNDPCAVYWHCVAPDQRVYTYRELYVNQTLASDVAKMMVKMSEGEDIAYTVASPDMWQKRGGQDIQLGESIADIFNKNGVRVKKADNDRINGWTRMREFLATAPDGKPYWQIFSTCTNLIRTLPMLIHDDNKVEDVSDKCEDHAAESCLTGDTIINTLKGEIPISALVGKECEVYCYDEENSQATTAKCYDVRLTQKKARVYEVEIEDGRTIKGTENHLILTDNGWKRLLELQSTDNIIDIHSEICYNDIEVVKDAKTTNI